MSEKKVFVKISIIAVQDDGKVLLDTDHRLPNMDREAFVLVETELADVQNKLNRLAKDRMAAAKA